MSNLLEQSQKHLLTEQVNKASTSFIANINTVASFVSNSTNITNLNNVGTIQASVDTINSTLTTVQNNISTNTSNISTINNKLTANDTNISNINTKIANLGTADSKMDTRITALENAVPTMPDMTNYYTKTEVAGLVDAKRDKTDSYSKDEVAAYLVKKLDATTDTAKAGCILQVGDDGKIIYNPNLNLKWGNITGDISTQKDLQDALALKADKTDIHNPRIRILRQNQVMFEFTLNQEVGGDVDVANVIDYVNDVNNKPKINGVTLEGNTSSEDLNLNAGIILSSGTDVAFTAGTLPASGHWVGAAYNAKGTVLIAVGYTDSDAPLVYKSTDYGKTWTGLTAFTAKPYAIAYGNNTFVVTTNSNAVYTSFDDGATWEFNDIGANKLWSNLAYGNGYFVAVAALVTDGTYGVARSINGQTWTLSAALTKIQIADLIYGGGKFVVLGTGTDANYLGYSSDYGTTWNTKSLPSNKNYTKLGYLNGSYLILNGDSADNTIYIANSDFSSIVGRTIYSGTHDGMHSIMCTDNDVKIFPGKTNAMLSSEDLTTWSVGKVGTTAEWYSTAHKDTNYIVLSGYSTQSDISLIGTADRKLVYNGKDVTDEVKKVLGIA